jgi:hypothetical protein
MAVGVNHRSISLDFLLVGEVCRHPKMGYFGHPGRNNNLNIVWLIVPLLPKKDNSAKQTQIATGALFLPGILGKFGTFCPKNTVSAIDNDVV